MLHKVNAISLFGTLMPPSPLARWGRVYPISPAFATPAPAMPRESAPDFDRQRRLLDYAFGAQGDIVVIEHGLTRQEIEQFSREAELIGHHAKKEKDDSPVRPSFRLR